MNNEPTLHAGVAKAAKLGARELVFPRLGRFEPTNNLSARHNVLLKAQIRE